MLIIMLRAEVIIAYPKTYSVPPAVRLLQQTAANVGEFQLVKNAKSKAQFIAKKLLNIFDRCVSL